GLEVGKTYTHTFYDHIILSVAEGAEILATDEAGRPLVAVGSWGSGKFCACGLGIGIGPGDADVPLSDPEARLLVSVIRNLSR
ncbi:MAG: hypothetical protein H5T86_03435, partial [Armatimonadetes bacterium]|nr:hypothetical protein [Armatimonadota bacterium]